MHLLFNYNSCKCNLSNFICEFFNVHLYLACFNNLFLKLALFIYVSSKLALLQSNLQSGSATFEISLPMGKLAHSIPSQIYLRPVSSTFDSFLPNMEVCMFFCCVWTQAIKCSYLRYTRKILAAT